MSLGRRRIGGGICRPSRRDVSSAAVGGASAAASAGRRPRRSSAAVGAGGHRRAASVGRRGARRRPPQSGCHRPAAPAGRRRAARQEGCASQPSETRVSWRTPCLRRALRRDRHRRRALWRDRRSSTARSDHAIPRGARSARQLVGRGSDDAVPRAARSAKRPLDRALRRQARRAAGEAGSSDALSGETVGGGLRAHQTGSSSPVASGGAMNQPRARSRAVMGRAVRSGFAGEALGEAGDGQDDARAHADVDATVGDRDRRAFARLFRQRPLGRRPWVPSPPWRRASAPASAASPACSSAACEARTVTTDERDQRDQRQQTDELDRRLSARRRGTGRGGSARGSRHVVAPGHACGRKWDVADTRPIETDGRTVGMRTETRTSPSASALTRRPRSRSARRWPRAAAAASCAEGVRPRRRPGGDARLPDRLAGEQRLGTTASTTTMHRQQDDELDRGLPAPRRRDGARAGGVTRAAAATGCTARVQPAARQRADRGEPTWHDGPVDRRRRPAQTRGERRAGGMAAACAGCLNGSTPLCYKSVPKRLRVTRTRRLSTCGRRARRCRAPRRRRRSSRARACAPERAEVPQAAGGDEREGDQREGAVHAGRAGAPRGRRSCRGAPCRCGSRRSRGRRGRGREKMFEIVRGGGAAAWELPDGDRDREDDRDVAQVLVAVRAHPAPSSSARGTNSGSAAAAATAT